jgi:ABC-type multidrug transport system ATPase subunit
MGPATVTMATEAATAPAAGPESERPQAPEAIRLERLTRRFGEREALADVTTAVGHGQTLAVLGRNGAGKTTLLRVLATLLLPHSGSVRVFGLELPGQAHAVRARIGMLGHETLLYRDLTARENLTFYARLYGIPEPDARIAELLEATGIARRAEEPILNLSRGMAQRVAVCRASLHRPELLLLDEPHAHLDPEAAALVEPLIGRASGATRVLVSHDVDRVLAEADRVLGLRDGRVVVDAPASEVSPSVLDAVYGGLR